MPRIKRLTAQDFFNAKEEYIDKNVDLVFKSGKVSHVKVLEINDGVVTGENKLFHKKQKFYLAELWEVLVSY